MADTRRSLGETLKAQVPLSTRRRLKLAMVDLRKAGKSVGLLPDFLIIGAQRGGTSSLFKYLGAHPSVVPSIRKETEYFSIDHGRGLDWYRAHFPSPLRRNIARRLRKEQLLTFEATPDYLFYPKAPGRARALVPDAKLIVLLRNPVDRAVSHYQHMVRLGIERRSLDDALADEEVVLPAELARLTDDPTYDSDAFKNVSYFARGVYADQFERWFGHFPRDAFLVIRSEEFYARLAGTYRQCLDFLGLPHWEPREFINHSYGARDPAQGPRVEVPASTRSELSKRYEPHNRRLYDLLGRDFGW